MITLFKSVENMALSLLKDPRLQYHYGNQTLQKVFFSWHDSFAKLLIISSHLRSLNLQNFPMFTRNATLYETFIVGGVGSTSFSYFPKIIVTISSSENRWLDQENNGILASFLCGEWSGTSRFSLSLASGFL